MMHFLIFFLIMNNTIYTRNVKFIAPIFMKFRAKQISSGSRVFTLKRVQRPQLAAGEDKHFSGPPKTKSKTVRDWYSHAPPPPSVDEKIMSTGSQNLVTSYQICYKIIEN